MTTTERLARLEAAQEVLGFLMAARAEAIHKEAQKPSPDSAKIERLEAERNNFFEIEDRLRLDDPDSIERVISEFGPAARASFLNVEH